MYVPVFSLVSTNTEKELEELKHLCFGDFYPERAGPIKPFSTIHFLENLDVLTCVYPITDRKESGSDLRAPACRLYKLSRSVKSFPKKNVKFNASRVK